MTQATGLIVVGVDGSDHSVAALEWAIDEARRRGSKVEVLHSWQYLPVVAEPMAGAPPIPFEELAQNAQRIADDAIAKATGGADPGVALEVKLIEGPPAAALLDAAKRADLLVVGSRGRGGFKGLLLGSVSQQLTHHAHCPVVILPKGVGDHEQP